MIYILEGLNGTGKSTTAQALARALQAPVWRPFRTDHDVHRSTGEDDELGQRLAAAAVPVNTYVDDLYVAEALFTLRPQHVVLDRSMPSAFVYGTLKSEPWLEDKAQSGWIWKFWESLLLGCVDVIWVQLQATYDLTVERCDGRWHPNKADWNKATSMYTKLMARSALPKMVVNTGLKDVHATVRSIIRQTT